MANRPFFDTSHEDPLDRDCAAPVAQALNQIPAVSAAHRSGASSNCLGVPCPGGIRSARTQDKHKTPRMDITRNEQNVPEKMSRALHKDVAHSSTKVLQKKDDLILSREQRKKARHGRKPVMQRQRVAKKVTECELQPEAQESKE